MDIDPRAALDRFIEALTSHHEAVSSTQDPDSPAVLRATEFLIEAFVAYDDSLFTHYDADLPFDVYDEDGEDEDEDDDEDDEDDSEIDEIEILDADDDDYLDDENFE